MIGKFVRFVATAIVCLLLAAVFGLLLNAALTLKTAFPLLAGLAGLALVGLTCWLAQISLR